MENSISQTLTTTMLLLAAFFMITPTIESLCSDAMATALSSSGFTLFAQALHRYNITTNAARLTYLAPPDNALINLPLDADSVRSHVSNVGAFLYQSLLTIPRNTTLPTLRNTTLIVGTDGERVSLNDVLVIVPNLYIDGSCAVHGVDGPLVQIPVSSWVSSSSVDNQDFPRPRPRIGIKPSPASTRRRVGGIFKEYVRFIRRANRPTFVNENGKP